MTAKAEDVDISKCKTIEEVMLAFGVTDDEVRYAERQLELDNNLELYEYIDEYTKRDEDGNFLRKGGTQKAREFISLGPADMIAQLKSGELPRYVARLVVLDEKQGVPKKGDVFSIGPESAYQRFATDYLALAEAKETEEALTLIGYTKEDIERYKNEKPEVVVTIIDTQTAMEAGGPTFKTGPIKWPDMMAMLENKEQSAYFWNKVVPDTPYEIPASQSGENKSQTPSKAFLTEEDVFRLLEVRKKVGPNAMPTHLSELELAKYKAFNEALDKGMGANIQYAGDGFTRDYMNRRGIPELSLINNGTNFNVLLGKNAEVT